MFQVFLFSYDRDDWTSEKVESEMAESSLQKYQGLEVIVLTAVVLLATMMMSVYPTGLSYKLACPLQQQTPASPPPSSWLHHTLAPII